MSQVTMSYRENNTTERNPFQRNGRSNTSRTNRSNGSGGYNSWKKTGGDPYNPYSKPLPPKEKVLTADDFPALGGPGANKAKPVWGPKETKTSLADRVKEVIAKEEEARARGIVEENDEPLYSIPIPDWIRNSYQGKREQEKKRKEQEEEKKRRELMADSDEEDEEVKTEKETKINLPPIVVPLSDWVRSAHLAKKQEEEWKRREWEAEEANYRWQISSQMFPPKPESPMPAYDDELEEERQSFYEEELEEVRD